MPSKNTVIVLRSAPVRACVSKPADQSRENRTWRWLLVLSYDERIQ
jgi:hypothetical protein